MAAEDSRVDTNGEGSWLTVVVNKETGDSSVYSSGVSTAVTETRITKKSFRNNKGWRTMKVKPIAPYSRESWRTVNPIVSWTNVDDYGKYQYHHSANADVRAYGGNLTAVGSIDLSHVDGIARNKLLQKLNTAKSSSLVSLAEAGKTAKHLALTATRIANALRALRRFDAIGVSQALGISVKTREVREVKKLKRRWELSPGDSDILTVKGGSISTYDSKQRYERGNQPITKDFLGNAWLEYSYGWKPLLNDVYDHANALAYQMTEHQNLWIAEKASASEKKAFYRSYNQNESRSNSDVTEIEVRCTYGVRYSRDNVTAFDTFGLNNPALVAWELVPFSFVVDWFLPIGNALENLTSTSGLVFHGGYINVKRTEKTTSVVRSRETSAFNGGTRTPGGSGTCSTEYVSFSRDALSSFPVPAMPSFKDPRSFSHAASAISLLNSLFLSRK